MAGYDSREFDPPAPVADVTVSNPVSQLAESGQGKIDTGADITIIPDAWVAKTRLIPAGIVEVASFDGRLAERPAYYVNILIDGFRFELVRVLSTNRTNTLLGRDVLNQLKLTLDAKNLHIHISDP